jgi:hypothetical protein
LAGRIERIEALQRQIDAADAAVRANPVDDTLIGRVRQADRTRREAAAALHAGAPEVAIDALQRIETRVNEETVGLSAGAHRDFRAAEAFRFELPDVLRLRVRPGASLAALQLARAETEKEIERLLRECGADSVERAERCARERARAREDSKTANTEARALLGGEDLSLLRTRLVELDSRMADLSEVLEDPDALDKAAADSASLQAGAQYDQVSNRLRGARAAFSGLSEPYGREKERLEQAGRSLEAARVGDRNATAALTEARQRADDESLGAGLAEAERRLAEASAALTTERRALEAYDEESIRTLATNS